MSEAPQQRYAIIVAGGSGSRMRSALPKQFLPLRGKPVLMHTLLAWHAADQAIRLILVLPEAQISFWESLCREHGFTVPHEVTPGGASRFQSTACGLVRTSGDGLVAVHDGVRPFVSAAVIHACYETAAAQGAAVASVPLKDSIREVLPGEKNAARDRSAYRIIQTPQAFRLSELKQAFEKEESPLFTDDASVYEAWGGKIALIEGEYSNIKITTPEDMIFAEAHIKAAQEA